MTTKKETDDLGPKSRTRKPSQHKIDQFVEGIAAGKSGPDAVIDAGWPQQRNSAKVRACKLLANPEIAQAVERRKAEAMRRANCHTDIVIGSLVEITTSSIADVCDEEGNFSLPLAVALTGRDSSPSPAQRQLEQPVDAHRGVVDRLAVEGELGHPGR